MPGMGDARLHPVVVRFDAPRAAVAAGLCRGPNFGRLAQAAVVYTTARSKGPPTAPFQRGAHTGRRIQPRARRHDVGGLAPKRAPARTLPGLLGVGHPSLDGCDVGVARTSEVGWTEQESVGAARWNPLTHTTVSAGTTRPHNLAAAPREEHAAAAQHPDMVARQLSRRHGPAGFPPPARCVHPIKPGFAATSGGLCAVRRQRGAAGQRWEGSNVQ